MAAGPPEAICHGDFGPWNVVWKGHRPVGIID
ncbi:phosphotransferase [Streptomyces sp. NPDC102405]